MMRISYNPINTLGIDWLAACRIIILMNSFSKHIAAFAMCLIEGCMPKPGFVDVNVGTQA